MKFRGLFLALAVLVLLVGGLYWSNRESAAKTSAAPVSSSPKILALNQSEIVKLQLKRKDREDVSLSKDGSGTWRIIAPKSYGADSAAVSSLLSTISTLNSESVVEEKATDLEAYGLAIPSVDLAITMSGDKAYQLRLGDDTPTGGATYAVVANDPRVFTVASYVKNSLDKGLNDLRDKRLLTVESDKIKRLDLANNKLQIEFDRDQNHWRIAMPKPLRANDSEVDDLVRRLTDARIDLQEDGSTRKPGQIESSFAKAPLLGTVKLISDAGVQELTVRKVGSDYYGKSTVTDAPHKISNDISQEFGKSLDDFRNKKLFDFGYSDPSKIEFHDGSKAYFLTRSGREWWAPDGKKLDAAGADSFLDKLRDLTASKFVESGFANPAIQVSVDAERVLIAKAGSEYVAKREDDSTLYQMDSKTVEALQHAATELKPVTSK